jgi:hypothetical protein
MSFLEFFILGSYLCLLASVIVAIQVFQLGKTIEDKKEQTLEIVEEPFLESESELEEKKPFNPETEEYTMTENPMLRHRSIEQVD